MEIDIVGDLDASFSSCRSCHRLVSSFKFFFFESIFLEILISDLSFLERIPIHCPT